MRIPTEPIGSIPRPLSLVDAIATHGGDDPALDLLCDAAIQDTIERFEATGSPVICDGEQRKYHNFRAHCVEGLPNADPISDRNSTHSAEVDYAELLPSLSTSRETAFVKIGARVIGTLLAAHKIGTG